MYPLNLPSAPIPDHHYDQDGPKSKELSGLSAEVEADSDVVKRLIDTSTQTDARMMVEFLRCDTFYVYRPMLHSIFRTLVTD